MRSLFEEEEGDASEGRTSVGGNGSPALGSLTAREQLPKSADSDFNFKRLRQGAAWSMAHTIISAQFFSSCRTAEGLVFTATTAEWSRLDESGGGIG